jgi:sugar phosphate isomerase/epimerase
MIFGASSWPFQWDPPYGDTIRRVAGLGFGAIELIAWNKDFLQDYYTPGEVANLKAVLDGEGIRISQFVSTPHDLSSAEPSRRERPWTTGSGRSPSARSSARRSSIW